MTQSSSDSLNGTYRTSGSVVARMAVWIVGICLVSPQLAAADESVKSLLTRVPENANSVAVVRVQELLTSPRSVAEGWSDPLNEKLLFGSNVVPPWVQTLVVGSQIRLGGFDKDWSVGVLAVPPQFSLEELARRENARVEDMGGLRAVRGRRDAYFVDLGSRVLGVMSPAYRQDVARWSRRAAAGHGGVSDYLTQAAAASSHIVLALDLEDAFDPLSAREYLNDLEFVKTSKVPVVNILDLLRSLRGIRLLASVGDETQAKIALDFGKAIDVPPAVLKALTISAINDQGLYFPELDDATTSLSGDTFVLTMDKMSDESLRAVLSMIVTAAPDRSGMSPGTPSVPEKITGKEPAPSTSAVVDVEAEATKRYVNAINKMLADLEKTLNQSPLYLRTARWHDNFAARIERLPTAGVAADALDYGSRTSSRLRALAASLRGVAIKVNAQEGTFVYNTYVNPGWESYGLWGGYGYRPAIAGFSSNLQEVRQRQATAIEQGAVQREEIWAEIREDRNAMIRKEGPEKVKQP